MNNNMMSMSMSASTLTFSSQTSNTSELYENTATAAAASKSLKGKRRSWHLMPNKVSSDIWKEYQEWEKSFYYVHFANIEGDEISFLR